MIATAVCLSSHVNTERLRSQLDQLHSEAETTRRKANNARFRLLRLSEAAENLCRQAAVSVQVGKENEARELLLQKKKIMLALEKSKGRVELLDELAAKLNEAISIKEAQLVSNVASDLEFGGIDPGSPVRIVSPKQDAGKCFNYDYNIALSKPDAREDQNLVSDSYSEARILSHSEASEIDVPESIDSGEKARILSTSREVLENLGQKLNKIEEDLFTILELTTLMLKNEEKPYNSGVQQLMEIIENIRAAKVRIQKFAEHCGM